METLVVVQGSETYRHLGDAIDALDALSFRAGYLGGEVVDPPDGDPACWRIRAWFVPEADFRAPWMPADLRLLAVPVALCDRLGIDVDLVADHELAVEVAA